MGTHDEGRLPSLYMTLWWFCLLCLDDGDSEDYVAYIDVH